MLLITIYSLQKACTLKNNNIKAFSALQKMSHIPSAMTNSEPAGHSSYSATPNSELAWQLVLNFSILCMGIFISHHDMYCDQLLSLRTVSAAVRLMPSPPALVLSRNAKMSVLAWKSATMSRRSEILDDPSSRM